MPTRGEIDGSMSRIATETGKSAEELKVYGLLSFAPQYVPRLVAS
jgi:hypothetical protein